MEIFFLVFVFCLALLFIAAILDRQKKEGFITAEIARKKAEEGSAEKTKDRILDINLIIERRAFLGYNDTENIKIDDVSIYSAFQKRGFEVIQTSNSETGDKWINVKW